MPHLGLPLLYIRKCLSRLSTLQIGPNICPHCSHTEHCLALMDRQPMDQDAPSAEAVCIMPHDLHACPHLRSASLFPILKITLLLRLKRFKYLILLFKIITVLALTEAGRVYITSLLLIRSRYLDAGFSRLFPIFFL